MSEDVDTQLRYEIKQCLRPKSGSNNFSYVEQLETFMGMEVIVVKGYSGVCIIG